MKRDFIIQNKQGNDLSGEIHSVTTSTHSAVESGGSNDCMVILSHGFVSDRYVGGRFDKLRDALNTAGFDVLQFDYTGCGLSNKELISVAQWTDDLTAIIAYAKSLNYVRIAVVGGSLGTLTAIYNHKDLTCMVLLAPAFDTSSVALTASQQQEIKSKGYYTFTRSDNHKSFHVSAAYPEERKTLDIEKILKPIHCPVLIIHGTNDTYEPLQNSQKAIAYLQNGRLEIMEGADHIFKDTIDLVISLTVEFLNKHINVTTPQ